MLHIRKLLSSIFLLVAPITQDDFNKIYFFFLHKYPDHALTTTNPPPIIELIFLSLIVSVAFTLLVGIIIQKKFKIRV